MNKNIKRLMYISSEDFYLMTYLILVSLNKLVGKKSTSKKFKDHRKLIYLIQFLSDYRLIELLVRYKDKKIVNGNDLEFLFDSFTKAELHKKEVNKVLKVLEKKGYINLESTPKVEVYNVTLNNENLPFELINNNAFNDVCDSLDILKSCINSLSLITVDTFVDKVYRNNGVRVWAL